MNYFKVQKFDFRISATDQSLISQLFPISFPSSTQSTYIEQKESTEGSTTFRPIISKVLSKNILSSTNDSISQLLDSTIHPDQQSYLSHL